MRAGLHKVWRFFKLCAAMTYRLKSLVVAALLSLTAGHSTIGQAQQMGAGGPSGGGRGGLPPFGGVGGPSGIGGMSGRDPSLGTGFTRSPGDSPPMVPGRDRGALPANPPERVVPLNDAVSMVQERFNATAVKTDTVTDAGQVMYRIRLLSADKSRVWTVQVDARTGQLY